MGQISKVQAKAIARRQREQTKPLNRKDLEDLHSLLRRSAERAERNNRSGEHQALMRQLTALEAEMEPPSYADPPFACPPDEAK